MPLKKKKNSELGIVCTIYIYKQYINQFGYISQTIFFMEGTKIFFRPDPKIDRVLIDALYHSCLQLHTRIYFNFSYILLNIDQFSLCYVD